MAVQILPRVVLRRPVQQSLRQPQRPRQSQSQSQSQRLPHPQRAPSRPHSTSQPKRAKNKLEGHEQDQIPVANNVPTLPFWQRLGPLTRMAQAYGRAQRARPYTTQVCSSLVIYLAADISAQSMSGGDYDPARTGRSLTIGAISAIPSYEWFVFLSNNFNYQSRLLSLAAKVVVNQICYTPIFNSYFFGMQALLVGDSLSEIWQRIRRTVPISFVNSTKVWPAVTAFSFAFIPLEYRSVFAGVVAVGWQTYLSFLNRQAEQEEANGQAAVEAPVTKAREVREEVREDAREAARGKMTAA